MALQLTEEMPSGVSGNYFRIENIRLLADSTQCTVVLYKDSAARTADKAPLKIQTFEFVAGDNPCEIATMDLADSNPFKLCYDKLKTLPEFSGATDV
jgi:hypothetical protein